jgi:hypothetical protein
VARRILAAFLVISAVLTVTADRLSGEPTTTGRIAAATTTTTTTLPPGLGLFGRRIPPNPLKLYPRRPGAKFEDFEARGKDSVSLGLTGVNIARWSRQLHATLPPRSVPANLSTYEDLGLVDRYSSSATNTSGDLLHVVLRSRPNPLAYSTETSPACSLTAADDGTVLLPYVQFPEKPTTTTTTTATTPADPPPIKIQLYFPLGAHHGRVYLTCRDPLQQNPLTDPIAADARAVWGFDV